MPVMPALTLAATVMSVGSSISQGYQAKGQADYQAKLLEQKAGIIDQKKAIEAQQYDRMSRQFAGKLRARAAASGLEMSGSPAAVLIDSLAQIEFDKQLGQYNLEVDKIYNLNSANMYKAQGKMAVSQGYSKAFSTIMLYGAGQLAKGAGSTGSYSDPKGVMPKNPYNNYMGSGRSYYPGGYSGLAR